MYIEPRLVPFHWYQLVKLLLLCIINKYSSYIGQCFYDGVLLMLSNFKFDMYKYIFIGKVIQSLSNSIFYRENISVTFIHKLISRNKLVAIWFRFKFSESNTIKPQIFDYYFMSLALHQLVLIYTISFRITWMILKHKLKIPIKKKSFSCNFLSIVTTSILLC